MLRRILGDQILADQSLGPQGVEPGSPQEAQHFEGLPRPDARRQGFERDVEGALGGELLGVPEDGFDVLVAGDAVHA